MANTCFTDIFIKNDPDAIKKLQSKFHAADSVKGQYEHWLGNLWTYMGHSFDDAMDCKLGKCAGEIESFFVDGDDPGTLIVCISSKWEPQLKAIRDFVDAYAPGSDITYLAEEVSTDLFWTNKNADEWIFVGIEADITPDTRFLEDINCVQTMDQFVAAITDKAGIQPDPSLAGDAQRDNLIRRFNDLYGGSIQHYQYVSLDDVCQ